MIIYLSIIYFKKKTSACGDVRRPPDPVLQGLRRWTPLGDFRPVIQNPKNTTALVYIKLADTFR